MTTTADDVWKILAELALSQKETDRQLQQLAQDIDRVNQEVNQKIDAVNKQIKTVNQQISIVNKQISSLGGKWGRFVENIVAPSCETIFLIDTHPLNQRL